jgi:O-antigen/teichoic acid export membrane protein
MPSIKKNILYQSLYQLLVILVPLVIAPYLSRVLGAVGVGTYSYTSSVVTYFVYFANLGLAHHGARTIAAVRDDKKQLEKTFSNLYFFHITMTLFVFAVYIVFLMFFAGEYKLFFTIHAIALFGAMLDINWLFLGLEQIKFTVMRSSAVKITAAACVFIFVKEPGDLWKYVLIMSLGTLTGHGVVWAFLKRFTRFVKPTLDGIKPHIKPMFLLFVPVLALSVYNILDRIILGTISGQVQLGLYENSHKIILVPLGLITALNNVMLPRISNLAAKKSEKEKNRLTLLSMKYVMLLAVAMMFGIAGIADRFAPWFFGGEFRDSGVIIRTLCILIPFLAFQNVLTSQYLIPGGRDKIHMVSTVAGAVVSVTANIILIPLFGAMGAAVSIISAECLRCIIVSIAAKKQLPVGIYLKNTLFFFAAGAAMYLLVHVVGVLTNRFGWTILLQIITGAAFYLGVSALYLHFTKDAFFAENLNKLLRRIKS